MKRYITSLFLAAATCVASAASFSNTLTNGVVNVLLSTNANVVELTVASGTNALLLSLYDNNTAAVTYTNAAYVTRTTVATNYVKVFTNSLGITQTNTYPGIWTTTVTNAANTNNLPAIATFSLPANSTQTKIVNISAIKGLVANMTGITNDTCTISGTYYISIP